MDWKVLYSVLDALPELVQSKSLIVCVKREDVTRVCTKLVAAVRKAISITQQNNETVETLDVLLLYFFVRSVTLSCQTSNSF